MTNISFLSSLLICIAVGILVGWATATARMARLRLRLRGSIKTCREKLGNKEKWDLYTSYYFGTLLSEYFKDFDKALDEE